MRSSGPKIILRYAQYMSCTGRPSDRGNKISQNFLRMAGLIVLPLISLLTVGVIILTQNIARSPLSYLMLLRTKDIIMAIDLLICTALATAIYYVLVARDPQPQSSIDGSVEPPMIPSWVPWAGSLFHYFTHQLTFFKRYRYK